MEFTDMQQEEYVTFAPCLTFIFCFIFSLLECRPLTYSKFISSFSLVFAIFWVVVEHNCRVPLFSPAIQCVLSSSHCYLEFCLKLWTWTRVHFRLISNYVWFNPSFVSGISFYSLCVSFSLVLINSLFFSFMLNLFQETI